MAEASSWLPNLIGVVHLQGDGVTQTIARGTLNFVGATVTDNPDTEATDIDLGGAASLDDPTITGTTTTWGDDAAPVISVRSGPVVTTDAYAHALASFPIPESSTVDLIITIVGRRTGGSGTPGDCYRADFPVMYQRIGSATPVGVGGTASETGKKSNGGGSAYAGSVTTSGNSVVAYGSGASGTNVTWSAIIQGQVC